MDMQTNPGEELAVELEDNHAAAWRWAMACCRYDRDAAHDVLHDAYLKILQRRARFSGRSSFKTWLFGVIRLTALAANRRRALAGLLLEPIEDHPEIASADADENSRSQISPGLRKVLAALPARQRDVAILVFEHDMTVIGASVVLGISVGACRQHYARAKARLRAVIGENGDDHDG